MVAEVEKMTGLKPGEHRCPGPSTRDYLVADKSPPPRTFLKESYQFEGDSDLPYERYTSPEFLKLEMERLWPKVWQWVCRVEHIPDPGDYITYDIGNYSFIVVRGEDRQIRAFYNSCLHRGVQLRASNSLGNATNLRCPFHGWTYSLTGALIDVPCRWDFPHVKDEDFRLPEVKIAIWGGFVFLNMDPEAISFEEYLGTEALEHFRGNQDLSNRCVLLHVQKELLCNWKAANDAFLEAYHVVGTHPQVLSITNDAATQYDVFGENVTRFIHVIGVPSPHLKTPPATQEEILKDLIFTLPDGLKLPPGDTARAFAARTLRESSGKRVAGEQHKSDLSGFSDSEILDAVSYSIFPNGTFWPGISANAIYRFRPWGMDPDRSLFDLMLLRPLAPGEKAPEPPLPIRLGPSDSFRSVTGLRPGRAEVFDQDTSNLTQQQRGFHASKKRGETLGNYQEIRIRHVHNVIDRYLARK